MASVGRIKGQRNVVGSSKFRFICSLVLYTLSCVVSQKKKKKIIVSFIYFCSLGLVPFYYWELFLYLYRKASCMVEVLVRSLALFFV